MSAMFRRHALPTGSNGRVGLIVTTPAMRDHQLAARPRGKLGCLDDAHYNLQPPERSSENNLWFWIGRFLRYGTLYVASGGRNRSSRIGLAGTIGMISGMPAQADDLCLRWK